MKILLTILIGLVTVFTYPQQAQINATLLNTEALKENEVFLSRDLFDNIYTLEGDVLRKQSKYSTNKFSLPKFGKLTQVDLSNPLFPVLYYGDFRTIVITSKEFSLLNTIDLPARFPNLDPAYVASSTGKNLWIVNQANRSVVMYNLSTLILHTITTIKETGIKTYQSNINNLYWVTDTNVINGIDIHGNETVKYNLGTNYDQIQIVNNEQLFFLFNNKIYFVDMAKNKQYEIKIQEKTIKSFFYNTQKLSIFADHKLTNYQIKLP